MKGIAKYFVLFPFGCLMFSCRKDNIIPANGSSLTIVNAIVGSNGLRTNFKGNNGSKTTDTLKWYNSALFIGYGNYQEISSYNGLTPLTLSENTDTLHSVFNGELDLPLNSINTLFMTGTLAQPDTIFTTDDPICYSTTDSSMGVRFINLSPGSNPVNITFSSSPMVNEFSSIAYKGITDFKKYPVIASISSYVFQFRDAISGVVIGSYTMSGINNGTGTNTSVNSYRFRNFTIAFKGLPQGTGNSAQGTFLINNF